MKDGSDMGWVIGVPTLVGCAISALGAFVLPLFFPVSLVGAGMCGLALATLAKREYRSQRWRAVPLGLLAVGGLGLGLFWPLTLLAIWLS